ncbi:hypothetical protein P171DRAFT_289125 [Karstenula rhodostoma CBS 690.94]|uniref:Uncharacterized protein n=1 Tax=Karstenula rhodostoma CBS 690.94 TaxID=1392251 RepID=A0A9P4UCD0_9PLEO|nr:hypothetical protein P171DRAFT_289125 [Karstenula rhodostoma CBS 690.94]
MSKPKAEPVSLWRVYLQRARVLADTNKRIPPSKKDSAPLSLPLPLSVSVSFSIARARRDLPRCAVPGAPTLANTIHPVLAQLCQPVFFGAAAVPPFLPFPGA